MNVNGRIIMIDDDREDIEIFTEVYEMVQKAEGFTNELVTFYNPQEALEHLLNIDDAPFLIVSDINMPGMNGFELRKKTFENDKLAEKAAPYIFLTTAGNDPDLMRRAYKVSTQGYFAKPYDYNEYKELLTTIIKYWKVAKVANRIL